MLLAGNQKSAECHSTVALLSESHDRTHSKYERIRDRRRTARNERIRDIATRMKNVLQIGLNEPVFPEFPLVGQFDGGFEVANRRRNSRHGNDVPIVRGCSRRNTAKSKTKTHSVIRAGRD